MKPLDEGARVDSAEDPSRNGAAAGAGGLGGAARVPERGKLPQPCSQRVPHRRGEVGDEEE